MRLLEIKKKLEQITVDGRLAIDSSPGFGGQAQQIQRSKELFSTLELLNNQPWNKLDFTPIQQIIDRHKPKINTVITIDQSEFNELDSYINNLNQQLPIFIGIIEGITEEQNPQDINIKLSSDVRTPEDLTNLLSDIDSLSKISDIDGKGIIFKNFDRGSEWLVLCIIGPVAYTVVIKSLKLAQEVLKTKKEYFNSKKAELDYRASLEKSNSFSKQGLQKYQEKRTQIQIEMGVEEIVDEVSERNGFEKNEITTRTRKTVDCLIKIMNEGNEVHVSLNPPKEVTETSSGLVDVDYSYLEKAKKQERPKQIESNNKEENTQDATEES